MRLPLAIASFVILIVHGAVLYNQFANRWERHQTAYFDQARSMSTRPEERAEMEARAPHIEQVIVSSFGDTRVDRCTTCHISSDDPRFANYAQPLKTHPYSEAMGDVFQNGRWQRRHKFTDFGCTVCHDGQGRGLETHYSHGEDEFWPDPLLGYVTQANWRRDFAPHLKGKEYMEANCAQCHTEENFAGTPNVNRGRKLFYAMNCYGCHKIDGLSEGTLGPDLTEAGKKFKIDYLWESIVEPRANLATSFMPKFNLSDADVKALVVFLKSRRGVNFAETSLDRYKAHVENISVVIPPGTAGEKAGEQLIADRACTACHKLKDRDGGVAPDLSYEGLIRDNDWLMTHFHNPRSRVPDSIMPSFRFPDDDFTRITAYLVSLKTPPPRMSPADTYRALCARCHGEKGDGNGTVAWYIDPSPRDFTRPDFMNTKPRERFVKSIQEGVGGTSMPAWGKALDEDQVNGVLTYVLQTFTKEPERPIRPRNLPDHNPAASSPASIAHGERIFLQRCTGCHGRKADGKGPNSADILPHPRNLRNSFFVARLSDQRMMESILYGVQGTAMPSWIDYGLSQQDVGDIMNFIRSLNPQPGSQPNAIR
ncbi:MAG TPA: c-type cytochrome [Verrucomicrobiae bacterium]|nr:c-type cytochrome [Verrucomicrobiae bacterium]